MTNADAKATVATARKLREQAQALTAAPKRLRELARDQLAGLTEDEVAARLADLPVSALRDVLGKRVRLGQAEVAGYTTVGSVDTATATQLQAAPGVGAATARQLLDAAALVRDRVAEDVRVRLDVDERPPAQAALLATLTAIGHADRAVSAIKEPLRRLDREVAPLLEDAGRAARRLSMLFSWGGKKQSARSALSQLDEVLARPETLVLRENLAEGLLAADPSSYGRDELWRAYLADAASFNALLSTLGGAGESDDQEAARGFVPEELNREISATSLDTRLLTATLRGYQVFGAQYVLHRGRAILGDEMGLGKTVEALAVLAHLAAKGQQWFLVVCPASVQVNWLNEIERHTGLAAHSLHGPGRDVAADRWNRTGGVAVTTFGTLPKLDLAQAVMVVVDEAHQVKNPAAQRSRGVRKVVETAPRALFLTGTPMENRVGEFRNLVGYLQPDVAERIDAGDALAGAKAFRRTVAPVYLRRNQEDVLGELPDLIEVEDWVRFTREDEAAYLAAVRSGNLMAVRQGAFQSASSAKLERLAEIVSEAREDGLKVLIFSNFLAVLAAVERKVGDAVTGRISGSVPPARRQEIVDAFTAKEGHAVLLGQIEASGVGLNVQAASVVVIAEPQWKPGTEEQAIARAHRMGQVRKVQVHRLLAKDSVDDRIREIQEGKRLLFDEFARKSEVKEQDRRSVDTGEHRPAVPDVPEAALERRVLAAERHRLGLD
ncbi:DEAD/DEAH box helicase [Amycolatopsis sp. H20-H5]|uniref:DEAD/DEAH box helicase n=1 Tax=Amycolatopsis sp. H20-H5 TaxID=3046309 RepID=UPI002DBDAD49|nr:DEAD/DEAH box helicase [Amycolatopsis sp. H20-H5]MEC3977950.1 DEAD/DEAH box helicase [Amycolatopsis sp. H20-H5]